MGFLLTAPRSLIQVAFREMQFQERQDLHSDGMKQQAIVLKPWGRGYY